MTFTPKAQAIIDSLAAIDKNNPKSDKALIESCFAEHFKALGMTPLPVRWVKDAEEGYKYVTKIASAAWSAAWSAAESAAWSAARSAAWSAAWSAARSAARSAAWSAAESAARSAARSAAWFNCSDKPTVIKNAGIWLPFLNAHNAGLWLYWVTEKEVVACLAPSLKLFENRLHCEDGPAVSWPDGARYYFLKGIQITKDILDKKFDWKNIDAQTNSEVRRIMMDLYGTERYVSDSGIKPIHSDDFGTLYRRDNKDGTVFTAVKVVNCTAEPDGSFKDYWLRVNHKLYGGDVGRIAWAAVASTWRTKGGKLAFAKYTDYLPAFET